MPNALNDAASGAQPAPRRFRPSALPTLATVAAVIVCVSAGNWQAGRMHEKEALRARYDAAAGAAPLVLAALPVTSDWTALRYRPVVATGAYLASRQFLVDNRVQAGRAGFHVVTPLALDEGRVVLVNRGWIAQGASRAAPPNPPPPGGRVSVRGRIAVPATGYLELKPAPVTGVIWQNLDPARYAAATGLPVLPAVVEATAAPEPDDGLVRDWPAPDFMIDTHRIYRVQWYAFAVLAVVLWIGFNRPRRTSRSHG